MLNIGKLRRGGENYYLNSVARGVEDYYLGSGEAPGYWLASGAAALRLAGEVGDDQLRDVLRGLDPTSGEPLGNAFDPERVPGFDLTFLAPKSVALLHELSAEAVSQEVGAAHEAAVGAALGYMERHASGARRGKGGRRSIGSDGFIAAAFRHRTSRAGDPLLHTHVLVANLIRGRDGKWGALDAKHLYRHAKTAGYLYQAHLRVELTRRLGVEWTPVRKGAADIEGVPTAAIKAFSKRRAEVRSHLEAASPTGRQREVAALKTRQAKDYSVSPRRLLPAWKETAEGAGLDRGVLQSTLGRAQETEVWKKYGRSLEAAPQKLASPQGLTEGASTFTRREVLQGFCAELPYGAEVQEIERHTDLFLCSDLVVPLSVRATGPTAVESNRVAAGRATSSAEEKRYSTSEMLEVEHAAIERAVARRSEGAGIANAAAVDAALERRSSLYPDQRAMIRSLTSSGLGVEVVIGKAGAGKTFALDAARECWESSGYRVIGCSLSARAAQELQSGSGIQSYTIAGLLQDLETAEAGGLGPGAVVVVDEAGMVGTRNLDRLLHHAQLARAKVVLVGDDRQLPEIQAGGAFRGIKNRLPAIELTEVRRQPFGWERDALDLLREGKAVEAIAEYIERGRVHVASSAEETRQRLVADWWETSGLLETGVMIAAHRSDVADLNHRARCLLRAAGRLGLEEMEVFGERFSVGDRVMALKNARRLGVFNGTRGVVEALDLAARTLTIALQDGSEVVLPTTYLEDGHLTHAYAITGHKAQGMTTERAFILGDETLYREWGYVAMSRGKESNSLYVVAGSDPEREELGGQVAGVEDPMAELVRALGRSRAKDLAVDVYEHDKIKSLSNAELRTRWEKERRILDTMPASVHGEIEQVRHDLHRVSDLLLRQERRMEALAAQFQDAEKVRGRRKTLGFRAARSELSAEKERWVELRDRREALVDRQRQLVQAAADRESWFVEHAPSVRRLDVLGRELWWREQQRAIAAEVAMPQYLLAAVGERPEKPSERAAWRESVRAVESYRERWGVTDEQRALGEIGDGDEEQVHEREDLGGRLRRAPQELERSGRSLGL